MRIIFELLRYSTVGINTGAEGDEAPYYVGSPFIWSRGPPEAAIKVPKGVKIVTFFSFGLAKRDEIWHTGIGAT